MSTASRRSSSVSSASSSGNSTSPKSSKSNIAGIKKKFACNHEGCGKSFSRSEHLHRHALNHKDGNNTCLRCSAHFRRRDLLDRHMARHKEKDDEAGGEGLGFLATRKRLWRDPDGNIVNCRRPQEHQAKRRQLSALPERTQRRRSSAGSLVESQNPVAIPLSPPISIPSTVSASGSVPYSHNEHLREGAFGSADGILDHSPMLHEAWNVDPMLSSMNTAVEDFDFLCNSGWGQPPVTSFETFMGAGDLPYEEDIFKPDTELPFNSSFNAPFTTPSYYSWLFDKDSNSLEIPTNEHKQLPNSSALSRGKSASSNGDSNAYSSNMSVSPKQGFSGQPVNVNNALESPSDDVPAILASMHMQTEPDGLFRPQSKDTCSSRFMSTNGYSPMNATIGSQVPRLNDGQSGLEPARFQRFLGPQENIGSSVKEHGRKPPSRGLDTISPLLPPDACPVQDSIFPKINDQAREGLMQLIGHARPCKPNGNPIMDSDPLLSITSLQNYCNLFFSRFNSSYPLIHQPTFDASNCHPFLLMAILLLGATYGDKEAHLLAVCIHDIMRPLIHSSKDFSTKPKLWMLQTILLVECFGKNRAGEKQHDMSHLYHGLLINLIRRSDCQSAYMPPFNEAIHGNLENYWKEAVVQEQKRRLALLCFMWDTQHALLFSQSLCMNASELQLTLPWDPPLWQASSAEEWHHLTTTSTSPPQYLFVLKAYTTLSCHSTPCLNNLNALSRVLILHGLMSLAWDLNRRDQTFLSLSNLKPSSANLSTDPTDSPKEHFTAWKARIGQSYDVWKQDFESYTNRVLNSLSTNPIHRAKFQRFAVANLAIYHTAKIILAVDIIDLQIFAGARHIVGRGVTAVDRERSRRRVGEWLGLHGHGDMGRMRRSAAGAVWHAARLFRDGLIRLDGWNVDDMFHYPWCLYLAALMCWVFHEAATGRITSSSASHNSNTPATAGASPSSSRKESQQIKVSKHRSTNDDEDSEWDARAEMNAFISGITRFANNRSEAWEGIWSAASKFKVTGLLKIMAKQLNTVRWAVVREGHIVLRELVEGH